MLRTKSGYLAHHMDDFRSPVYYCQDMIIGRDFYQRMYLFRVPERDGIWSGRLRNMNEHVWSGDQIRIFTDNPFRQQEETKLEKAITWIGENVHQSWGLKFEFGSIYSVNALITFTNSNDAVMLKLSGVLE